MNSVADWDKNHNPNPTFQKSNPDPNFETSPSGYKILEYVS